MDKFKEIETVWNVDCISGHHDHFQILTGGYSRNSVAPINVSRLIQQQGYVLSLEWCSVY